MSRVQHSTGSSEIVQKFLKSIFQLSYDVIAIPLSTVSPDASKQRCVELFEQLHGELRCFRTQIMLQSRELVLIDTEVWQWSRESFLFGWECNWHMLFLYNVRGGG